MANKFNPVQYMYLRSERKNYYRIFNEKGITQTLECHFGCFDEALEWAMCWTSSWPRDVMLDVDIKKEEK